MAQERLFLIDGSSMLYRAHYALMRGGREAGGRPGGLATSGGIPTGATYGFLQTLRKIFDDHRPEYVGIAFDHRVPTFRHEAYAEYKANRRPMPDDLRLQVPYVWRAVEALRIPRLMIEGFEADDLLGTLARLGAAAGLDVVIVTTDKDMYQLLGPQVSMLQVRTETRWLRAEDIPGEFGVRPEQVPDVLALWGDPTDNIPGVKGIGEKGAKELVTRWGSLEAVYANLDQLRPAQAVRLKEGEAEARLSRELAVIRTDLDVPLDREQLRRSDPDRGKLLELCRELEFRNLVDELAPARAETGDRPDAVIGDADALERWCEEARTARRLSLEVVLTGEQGAAGILGLALAVRPDEGRYVPSRQAAEGPSADALPLDRLLAIARPILEDPQVAKVAADLKAAVVALAAHGIDLAGATHDIGILSYLLDPGRSSHDVEALAPELLDRAPVPRTAVLGTGRERVAATELAPERLAAWAADRAELALALAEPLASRLEDLGLLALYRDIELPLVAVLARMEMTGVLLDVAFLKAMAAELEARLVELTRRIHALAGMEFNINSPRQLGEVLFDKMQLPVLKKTRKARAASTDLDVLEELAVAYELPRLVLEHRELSKLKGTYVEALPDLVDAKTGRLHTSYNQTVAATGRLSSSEPNLQNVPIRTDLGRRIRRAFVAPPGTTLLVADYSQIELRLVAHLSADPDLCAAFRDGADVHTRTAATMFDIAEGLVTSELRRRAKVINFGIIYGMSAYGLSRELRVAPAEASRLIAQYFERYAGVRSWIERTIAGARESGTVRTMLGRIRQLPDVRSERRTVREYAERIAVNTPIQGTAADLIKLAMVRIDHEIRARHLGARLLLQVHDELVLEVPPEELETTTALVRESMEGAAKLEVPLEVRMGSGPNWLEAK